jgi:hypothetical protein
MRRASPAGSQVQIGGGNHKIHFLTEANADTLVIRTDGVNEVSGLDPRMDVLDIGALLSAASLMLNNDIKAVGDYLTIVDQDADIVVRFDPTGRGAGMLSPCGKGSVALRPAWMP